MSEKTKSPYDILRSIDVSEHVEKKNGFSYLSWAWAVDKMFQFDPEAGWEYPEREIFPDGTIMVYCDVTIKGKKRRGYLPCLDFKNQPIKNPNAFQINTSMQRCLVKTIALHGLGLYIYAGEDLPEGAEEKPKEFTREHKIMQRDFLYNLARQKSRKDVMDYYESWEKDLATMPAVMSGMLEDAIEARKMQIINGVNPPVKYGFIDVQEALEFMELAGNILVSGNTPHMRGWVEDNQDVLKALDGILTAKKYNEGGSPYERFMKKYNERIKNDI